MSRRPLRLWPGVVAAIAVPLLRLGLPTLFPGTPIFGLDSSLVALLASMLGALAIIVWWAFFSRAPWADRLIALGAMALAITATKLVSHPSISDAGMGMMLYIYVLPMAALALVASVVASRALRPNARRVSVMFSTLLACGFFALLRTDGVTSNTVLGSDFRWRWTPTAEELLLANAATEAELVPPASTLDGAAKTAPLVAEGAPRDSVPGAAAPVGGVTASAGGAERSPDASVERGAATEPAASHLEVTSSESTAGEWPGFRGPERNSVIRNLRIATDWSTAPPEQMWRRPVGPGWSSFAVSGDLIYTQEQRGDDEMVTCYRLSTGEPVWRHRDAVRFWESNGGAGPRATPTLHRGRIYAFGATGVLNALDAASGKRLWSHDVSADTGRRVSDWGFASSPLLINDVVIVAAAGTLAGYDAITGRHRWTGPSYGGSYSSPHRVTIDGVVQALLLGGPGAISVDPATGATLWIHEWVPGPIVQPAQLPDGDLLINALAATGGQGTRRLHVSQADGGWRVEERWTSSGLKPYFNDFVVHQEHAYGFDNNILSSINLKDGTRNWKGGRFGNGQMVLLADQNLLLVLSEDGEVALVSAAPDKFTEVARLPVLSAKTWNHPVVTGDVLLVRNGEEMAAFRLPRVNNVSAAPAPSTPDGREKRRGSP